MKKCLFREKLGLRSKTWGKRLCFGRESPVFEEIWRNDERKRINIRAFSTLGFGLRCHMRSTFDERVFRQKSVFRNLDVSWFLAFFRKKCLSQKWSRSVWEVSGTIPDLLSTISDPFWQKNRLNKNIMIIPYIIPHSYPLMGAVMYIYISSYELACKKAEPGAL